MRDSVVLNWRHRPAEERPRVSICVEIKDASPITGRYTCLDNDVDELLCGNGEHPFTVPKHGIIWDMVPYGTGIVRDAFEPEHERPWAWVDVLMRQGYTPTDKAFLEALAARGR